ncbi:MAG: hypothetical protein KJ882_03680 [Proteobacteria bacterium]|nr:hypothetical protein [Pseudomonadota bacterium]MBU4009843.1 hypothetical protein [Pseudomonadota bacterium]MBU4037549.1 hypothetical protein [Pseudomonadota bacterium]
MIKLKGWAAVARDTFMFMVIAIVGFLVVPVIFGSEPSRSVLLIFNILLGVIAFCVSGCMMADNRWKHLNKVAMILCIIISAILIVTMSMPFNPELLWRKIEFIIINMVVSIIGVYIMMALGGGLSFVFVKADGKERKNIKNN